MTVTSLYSQRSVAAPAGLCAPAYRADIDGLRAIAVLLVIVFHAFPELLPGGFIGVDIFFVISGYLISSILFNSFERGDFSYLEFYARRIKRLFPALILVLASCFVLGWFFLPPAEYKQLGKHIAAGSGFISNIVLWQESGYFDADAGTKPLLHLWSLGVEEQFYLVWPLLLGLLARHRRNFLAIILIIGAASFAINLYTVSSNPPAAFYSPLSRFWELMLGGGLAYAALQQRGPAPGPALANWHAPAGLAMIACAAFLMTERSATPGWWALLPTLGAFLIIRAGDGAWLNRRFLAGRWLTGIGLISYPLYLWHWPLLSFLRIYEGGMPSLQLRLIAVELSFLLAWLTYRAVEKPFRSHAGASQGRIALLGIGMLLVSALGLQAYLGDGASARTVRQNPEFAYDHEAGYRYHHCFIDRTSDPSEFAPYCSGSASAALQGKPLVLIWGDSHGASLYPGLQNLSTASGAFRLAQYTTGGCPPLVGQRDLGEARCSEINAHVVSKIRQLRPDTVILSSYWLRCACSADDHASVRKTIETLKELKVKNIVLFGQLPTFAGSQPVIAKQEFIAGKVDRTFKNVELGSLQINDTLKRLAGETRVAFVSPSELLCNASGCLISASPQTLSPMAWDYGHLSGKGSVFLIDAAVKNAGIGLLVK